MRGTFTCQNALITKILNILYPSMCPVCGNISDVFAYSPICSFCWAKMEKYMGPSCIICAIPFTSESAKICGKCLKDAPPYSRVIAYGLYEGVMKEAINQLKFHRIRRLSRPLGKLFLNLDIPEADGIVPVPLMKKGLRERGFNQSLLMARVLSKKIRAPLLMDTLFKVKDTLPQIGLSAAERLSNLKNVFKVKGNVKDLRLLLVDDVMTTGATVTECSKALLKAGAKEVTVLVLARAAVM